MNRNSSPLSLNSLHTVDSTTVRQTLAESDVTHSIALANRVVVHHGTRFGVPIVIVEIIDQRGDELSAIWYDDGGAS